MPVNAEINSSEKRAKLRRNRARMRYHKLCDETELIGGRRVRKHSIEKIMAILANETLYSDTYLKKILDQPIEDV